MLVNDFGFGEVQWVACVQSVLCEGWCSYITILLICESIWLPLQPISTQLKVVCTPSHPLPLALFLPLACSYEWHEWHLTHSTRYVNIQLHPCLLGQCLLCKEASVWKLKVNSIELVIPKGHSLLQQVEQGEEEVHNSIMHLCDVLSQQ